MIRKIQHRDEDNDVIQVQDQVPQSTIKRTSPFK